jgi:hypothetical protein
MDVVQRLVGEMSFEPATNARQTTTLDSLKEGLIREQNNAALKKDNGEGMILLSRTLITNEYRPSNCDFIDLLPVTLKDLLVETVHSDCYMVLRCVYRRHACLFTEDMRV